MSDPWTYRADAAPQVERGAPSGPVGSTVIGGPLFTDAFGARRAPTPFQLVESYKSLLYACVQINANAVSQVPLRLYSDSSHGDEPRDLAGPRPVTRAVHARLRGLGYLRSVGSVRDLKEITDHPLLDCLDQPDPGGYFDRQSLLDLIVRYCDVVGTAYVLLDGPTRGVPRWLWPLASQFVTVVPAESTPLIEGYRYFENTYKYEQVLRFRCTPSLRDPYKAAFSPAYAATDYAGLEDAWVAIQTNLLGNGPRPGMIASAKDASMPPGDNDRLRLAQSLEMNHSRGNAGKVLVTNGAWDFTPWNYTPADLGGLEVSRYDLERTANVFGIPMPFLSGETNLANLQAAREQHAKNAVEPRCKLIASVLTRFVRRFDPRLFFAFDSAVPEDEERRAKIAQMRLTTGQTTINEENEELQWEPKPWGDEPWLAGSLKQPTMLQQSHEQGMEAAAAGIEAQKAGVDDQKARLDLDAKALDVQAQEKAKDEAAEDEGLEEEEEEAKPAERAIVELAEAFRAMVESKPAAPPPPARSSHRRPRVPEAMSAESILRLALRRKGWTAAYRRDELTPEQKIELLAEVREYARARLRAEAEAFAREHLGYEGRAIGDALAGQFRRFFGRVRGFVREAIVAGALALSGPGGLDADDLAAAEAAARVQDGFLAKFEGEMLAQPPTPIDPAKATEQVVGPDGTATEILVTPPGTTPGEFVARAESYGASVYASAQNVGRAKVGRRGAFDEERRVHLGHDQACPICEEATARGWQPIGTLPEIGDSYCLNNCHCFFEYRKRPEPAA